MLVKRGDHVSLGQLILELDDREAQIKLKTAEAELEVAKADYKLQTVGMEKSLAEHKKMKEKNQVLAQEQEERAWDLMEAKFQKARAQLTIAEQKVAQAHLELEPYRVKATGAGLIASVPTVGTRIIPGSPTAGSSISYLPDEED